MAMIFAASCPKCGSSNIHRSGMVSAKTLLAHALLMRAYRCHECMKLHFGPLWIKALPAGRRTQHKRKSEA